MAHHCHSWGMSYQPSDTLYQKVILACCWHAWQILVFNTKQDLLIFMKGSNLKLNDWSIRRIDRLMVSDIFPAKMPNILWFQLLKLEDLLLLYHCKLNIFGCWSWSDKNKIFDGLTLESEKRKMWCLYWPLMPHVTNITTEARISNSFNIPSRPLS